MLTLIAFIFATTNMVPEPGYFTRLDLFIGGALILVFLAMVQAVSASALVVAERTALARRIDRWSRVVYPLVFIALALAVFLFGRT